MSRWLLAVVAFGFACLEVRAADPKPLWEIDTRGNEKWFPTLLWVGISPDGKTLVAQAEERSEGNPKERLIAWDMVTRKQRFSLVLGGRDWDFATKRSNAFTKTGTVLVAGGSPKEVRLTDGVVNGKELGVPTVSVWGSPNGTDALWFYEQDASELNVAFGRMSPFGVEFPKPGTEGKWAAERLKKLGEGTRYTATAASPDTTRFVFTLREGTFGLDQLFLYTLAVDDKLKLTEVAAIREPQKGRIASMRFSPDSKTLATGAGDSSVCLWDVEKAGKNWKPRATLSLGRGTVGCLAFSPNGRTLVAGTWDKGQANLFFIDTTAEKVVASYRVNGQPMSVAFSPDGKTLVTGNYTGLVQAWDAEALRNP